MAYPAPTKGLSRPSPDKAMLFAPFRCTHLLSSSLLTQNPSPKGIAGYDIMKLKVSRCRYTSLVGKVLNSINDCTIYSIVHMHSCSCTLYIHMHSHAHTYTPPPPPPPHTHTHYTPAVAVSGTFELFDVYSFLHCLSSAGERLVAAEDSLPP